MRSTPRRRHGSTRLCGIVRLSAGRRYTSVVEATEAEREWLRQYVAIRQDGSPVDPGDRIVSLLDRGRIPTGMAGFVAERAPDEFQVVLEDGRGPAPRVVGAPPRWLRDYQVEAVQALFRGAELPGVGICSAGTGAGKTQVAVAAGVMTGPTARWLMLAATKDLMHQAASRWEELTSQPAGRLGDGHRTPARFTVATLATATAMAQKGGLPEVDGVILDECHNAGAPGTYKLLMSIDAYWRFGLSGTPLSRGDKRNMMVMAALGPIVYAQGSASLQEAGWLAKPNIQFIEYEHTRLGMSASRLAALDKTGWFHRHGRVWDTYQEAYEDAIVLCKSRNAAALRALQKAPLPALVFVSRLEHGKELSKSIERLGMSVRWVSGKCSARERRGVIEELERGDLDVIVASPVFDTGVDIPNVRCLMNAAAGESTIRAVQRLGRGLRKAAGKDSVVMIDFIDRGRWLLKHSRARAAAYKREGYQVEVTYDHQ